MEREKEQMMREKEELMLRLQDYEEKTRKAERGGPARASLRWGAVMGGRTCGQGHTPPSNTSPKQRPGGGPDEVLVWIGEELCAGSGLNAYRAFSS